ncbi:proline-rich protein HaeIII subfamily 1-like [Pan paniscus]|uniref:proline-rich protein HaeIII subfamily 1-like n=1 Tax=Pan paniscus TaxID=9597 RepID=UPI0007DB9347|nr:proline-rich protein HaeIII subfamily 1-like [Pan paniscus]
MRTAGLLPPHRRACRPSSRIIRVPMSTRDPGSPRRPRPGFAASLPPRGSPGAGQAGSGVLRPWARAPPPARPPPRSPPGRQPHWEQTLQVVHPTPASQRRLRSNLRPGALPQSLPREGSSGRGGGPRDGVGTCVFPYAHSLKRKLDVSSNFCHVPLPLPSHLFYPVSPSGCVEIPEPSLL